MDATLLPRLTERSLAASSHLGYAILGAAVGTSLADPLVAVPASLAVLALLVGTVGTARRSPFLREHAREARRHHQLGILLAVAAAVFTVWAGIFSWGVGAVLALLLLPMAAVAWMVPTLKAAGRALRGRPYRYRMEAFLREEPLRDGSNGVALRQ